jgi:hypothetical protein
VVGAVRALNQLELVGETLRATLNVLATVAPDWLKEQVTPDWYERYGDRMEDYRFPKGKMEREALSRRIGADGYHLLARIEQAAQEGRDWLTQLPVVQTLEQIWAQQYRSSTAAATVMRVVSRRRSGRRWASGCAPPMIGMSATGASALGSGSGTRSTSPRAVKMSCRT